jgi:hypothetical protein
VRKINAQIKKLRQDNVDDTLQAGQFETLKKRRTAIRSQAVSRTQDDE